MALKIMTWNIEQFGITRSNVDTRVDIVAAIIAEQNPDIFVLIELKTTKPADAVTILANRLIPKLRAKTNENYRFTLTYSNDLELYAFIYKQSITALTLDTGDQDEYNDFTDLHFTSHDQNSQATKSGGLKYYFPLLDCCYRAPGIGFFKVGTEYVAIIAWHNMANRVQAGYDIKKFLTYYDWLDQKTITIDADKQTVNITNIIITGDFNIDYTNDKYNYYSNLTSKYPACITGKTHLKEYNPGQKFSDYTDILSYGFDNFFITGFTNPSAKVISHPAFIHQKKYKNPGEGRSMFVFQRIAAQYLFGYEDCATQVRELLEKYLKEKFKSNMYRTFRSDINQIIANANIKLSKNIFDQITSQTLQNRFFQLGGNWQVKYQEFCTEAQNYANDQGNVLFRFNGYMMASSYTDLTNLNDLVLLSRWITDHLPIVLELN